MKIVDGKDKKIKLDKSKRIDSKKGAIIIISVVLVAVVGVCAGVYFLNPGLFGNNSTTADAQELSDAAKDKVASIKETYSNAGIKLSDDDIKVTEDKDTGEISVEVSSDKTSEADSKTDDTLDDIASTFGIDNSTYRNNGTFDSTYNSDLNSDSSSNDYTGDTGENGMSIDTDNNNTDNNQNTDDNSDDDTDTVDPTNGIDRQYLLDTINTQLGYVNKYITDSTNEETNSLYGPVLSQLLDEMKNGNGDSQFDIPGITNAEAYAEVCNDTFNNAIILQGNYTNVWTEKGLVTDVASSTLLSNMLKNGYYTDKYTTLILLTNDTSKSFEYAGVTINSSYAAVVDGGKTVYLDSSLDVLDIE